MTERNYFSLDPFSGGDSVATFFSNARRPKTLAEYGRSVCLCLCGLYSVLFTAEGSGVVASRAYERRQLSIGCRWAMR